MFNNENLYKLYKENEKNIELHIQKLDEISHDIKELDRILRSVIIRSGIKFNIEIGSLYWNGQNVIFDNERIIGRKLIETPLEIRLVAYEHLHHFLTLCLESIKEAE